MLFQKNISSNKTKENLLFYDIKDFCLAHIILVSVKFELNDRRTLAALLVSVYVTTLTCQKKKKLYMQKKIYINNYFKLICSMATLT